MIQGTLLKPLRFLPDERGFLMEMLRQDWQILEKFGQVYITCCKYGVVKGWHYHKLQNDHFVCVSGKVLVALYDNRPDSPTFGTVEEVTLSAPGNDNSDTPQLLRIPLGVVHGFTALEPPEARIVNITTETYNYTQPDEFRYPYDSPEIPYRWPEFVKSGR